MENRKDLDKYYVEIRRCIICKQKYGNDTDKDDGICPICQTRLHKRGRKKKDVSQDC